MCVVLGLGTCVCAEAQLGSYIRFEWVKSHLITSWISPVGPIAPRYVAGEGLSIFLLSHTEFKVQLFPPPAGQLLELGGNPYHQISIHVASLLRPLKPTRLLNLIHWYTGIVLHPVKYIHVSLYTKTTQIGYVFTSYVHTYIPCKKLDS